MTLFQAKFVQWLTVRKDCSLRATAGNFYARYNHDYSPKTPRTKYEGHGGNQISGITLREEAIKMLEDNGIEPCFTVY